jgi:hypothetical protein
VSLTCAFLAIWISEQQYNSCVNGNNLRWIRSKIPQKIFQPVFVQKNTAAKLHETQQE